MKLALFKTESARKPIDPDDDDDGLCGAEVARSATMQIPNPIPLQERGLAPDLIATKQGDAWIAVSFFTCCSAACRVCDLDDEELEISQNQPFWLLFPQMCVHKPAKGAWTESKSQLPLFAVSVSRYHLKDVSAEPRPRIGAARLDPTRQLSAAAALQRRG